MDQPTEQAFGDSSQWQWPAYIRRELKFGNKLDGAKTYIVISELASDDLITKHGIFAYKWQVVSHNNDAGSGRCNSADETVTAVCDAVRETGLYDGDSLNALYDLLSSSLSDLDYFQDEDDRQDDDV